MTEQHPITYRHLTRKQFKVLQWVLDKIYQSKIVGYTIHFNDFDCSVEVNSISNILSEFKNDVKHDVSLAEDYIESLYDEFHPEHRNDECLPFIYDPLNANGPTLEMCEISLPDQWMWGYINLPTTAITKVQADTLLYVIGQILEPSSEVALYLLDCPYLTNEDTKAILNHKQIKMMKVSKTLVQTKA